mmetsp:Transcript_18952/g.48858  ORF Transcript_18952/g.48858 Transcript_18952/m.48858 type:complete len:83 (-) Transcript_18952:180-428(-)
MVAFPLLISIALPIADIIVLPIMTVAVRTAITLVLARSVAPWPVVARPIFARTVHALVLVPTHALAPSIGVSALAAALPLPT